MSNWGAAVPIIVAIIGISGFIVPLLINQIINKPNLNIDIGSGPKFDTETIIQLTNSGTVPATNLSLIFTTVDSNKINNITNFFSTVNVTLAIPGSPHSLLEIYHPVKIDHSFVELHVKKLVNGDGSIIKLLFDARDTPSVDYSVYATYDQGSKKAGFEVSGITEYFYIFYVYLPLVIAESIVVIYLAKVTTKRSKRTFFSKLTQEIMDVRKELRITLLPNIFLLFLLRAGKDE
jgi:hypothetical protein